MQPAHSHAFKEPLKETETLLLAYVQSLLHVTRGRFPPSRLGVGPSLRYCHLSV